MDSRDPGDPPSKKSGASKRRRKHEREEAAAGLSPEGGAPQLDEDGHLDDGKWSEDFEDAGDINLDDPGTDLDYVRRLQLVCLRQMATTPFPSVAQRNCWARVREMSAAVGMTSNRAQLEAKVRKLERALAERKQDSGVVKVVHASKVKKPDTARGQDPGGPRALPEGDASVTPPPDDEE